MPAIQPSSASSWESSEEFNRKEAERGVLNRKERKERREEKQGGDVAFRTFDAPFYTLVTSKKS